MYLWRQLRRVCRTVGAATSGDAFCCAVDIVGPSNLITLHESIPPYWKPFVEHSSRMVVMIMSEEEEVSIKKHFSSDVMQIKSKFHY